MVTQQGSHTSTLKGYIRGTARRSHSTQIAQSNMPRDPMMGGRKFGGGARLLLQCCSAATTTIITTTTQSYCLLLVVGCWLFLVVCCLLFVVCCLLFVGCSKLVLFVCCLLLVFFFIVGMMISCVGAGRAANRMHLDSLAKNISSNKRGSFCSIYLSVISDLRKTHSQHITKRKTLLIDMCDRCIHPKTFTTSYEESSSESSVAVQIQGGCVSAIAQRL